MVHLDHIKVRFKGHRGKYLHEKKALLINSRPEFETVNNKSSRYFLCRPVCSAVYANVVSMTLADGFLVTEMRFFINRESI